jgi:5-formyltetrahydrofolate cyclo-ligase
VKSAEKSALRVQMRFTRQRFVHQLPHHIRDQCFAVPPTPCVAIAKTHRCIGGYWPLPTEADPTRIMAHFAAAGKMLALPFFANRSAPMTFRQWHPGDPLVKGPFGINQPCDSAPQAEPTLLICPLVAFTLSGQRLGQGGGHYDRYAELNPATVRIGLGWSVQQCDAIPAESHDAVLDAVITECAWIWCKENQPDGKST